MDHIDIVNFNRWAKSHITNESRFDNNGNIIMENNINYKSTGIISRIFSEHWNSYYSKMKDIIDTYRPNAPKEVQKVIDCSNHNLGSSVYVCPNCDEVFFCHHSCKGKLCSSCGIKAQKIKVEHILEKCITCNHRHITFTIPNDLNHFFFKYLNTNDLLFDSVCETIYSVINGKVKKHKISYWLLKYKPGFIAFLHTFGRPLNFNPHIHVIIAEKLFNSIDKKFKDFKYFNYDALSKRFMKILLDNMEKYFGKDIFKDIKNKMYLKYPNGFYVNNKLQDDGFDFKDIESLLSYLTRYCSRPAMAESRIINYDGNNVTYSFIDHTNEDYHEVTCSAHSFISKLLNHLLPSNFKSIRYFGFYNNSFKDYDNIINRVIKKDKIPFKRSLLKWSNLILSSFKRIPIKCPHCDILMELSFVVT